MRACRVQYDTARSHAVRGLGVPYSRMRFGVYGTVRYCPIAYIWGFGCTVQSHAIRCTVQSHAIRGIRYSTILPDRMQFGVGCPVQSHATLVVQYRAIACDPVGGLGVPYRRTRFGVPYNRMRFEVYGTVRYCPIACSWGFGSTVQSHAIQGGKVQGDRMRSCTVQYDTARSHAVGASGVPNSRMRFSVYGTVRYCPIAYSWGFGCTVQSHAIRGVRYSTTDRMQWGFGCIVQSHAIRDPVEYSTIQPN